MVNQIKFQIDWKGEWEMRYHTSHDSFLARAVKTNEHFYVINYRKDNMKIIDKRKSEDSGVISYTLKPFIFLLPMMRSEIDNYISGIGTQII